MYVLILSCNTGEGHNSCAKALAEECAVQGIACEIKDALRFISPALSTMVEKGHVLIYRRFPYLFRFGYRFVEQHPRLYRSRAGYARLAAGGVRRLAAFVEAGDYDAVVCTHPFASALLTAALERTENHPRTAYVATDYTCSPTTEQGEVDHYFIPSAGLAEEFARYGIDRARMIPSGIPIRRQFATCTDKAEAKRAFDVLPHSRHLLIMCGSMGCGPIARLVALLARDLGEGREITVVCGNNQKLYRKLQKKYQGRCGVHIRGYTKEMSRLMDSADLYLTKPGGISVSEAASKRLPMAFIDAVAGCEEYNRRYFSGLGAAICADKTDELARACLDLLDQPERLRQMSEAMSGESVAAAGAICRILCKGVYAGSEQQP